MSEIRLIPRPGQQILFDTGAIIRVDAIDKVWRLRGREPMVTLRIGGEPVRLAVGDTVQFSGKLDIEPAATTVPKYKP